MKTSQQSKQLPPGEIEYLIMPTQHQWLEMSLKKVLLITGMFFFIVGAFVSINFTLDKSCTVISKNSISCRVFNVCGDAFAVCRLFYSHSIHLQQKNNTQSLVLSTISATIKHSNDQLENRIVKFESGLKSILISLKIIINLDVVKLNGHMMDLFFSTKSLFRFTHKIRHTIRKYTRWSNGIIRIIKREYMECGTSFFNFGKLNNYRSTDVVVNGAGNDVELNDDNNNNNNTVVINLFKPLKKMNIISDKLNELVDHTSYVLAHFDKYMHKLKRMSSLLVDQKTSTFIDEHLTGDVAEREITKKTIMYSAVCLAMSTLALINPILLLGTTICAGFTFIAQDSEKQKLTLSKREILQLKDYIDQTILLLSDHIYETKIVQCKLKEHLLMYSENSGDITKTLTQYSRFFNTPISSVYIKTFKTIGLSMVDMSKKMEIIGDFNFNSFIENTIVKTRDGKVSHSQSTAH